MKIDRIVITEDELKQAVHRWLASYGVRVGILEVSKSYRTGEEGSFEVKCEPVDDYAPEPLIPPEPPTEAELHAELDRDAAPVTPAHDASDAIPGFGAY